MPYIAIEAFPKDEETKRKIVDRIEGAFLETWGCPREAITISIEEVAPSDWDAKVRIPKIVPNMGAMAILDGERQGRYR